MADIINASSGYQTGSIDTATTLINNVSPTDAKHINGPAGAIVQIETILGSGTTLKGSAADLATRLAVGLDSAGLLKLSTDASINGPLSVAKGGTGGTVAGTVGLVPPGTIVPYAMRSAPTGYLLCNGAAVSRTTYAALFAVLHLSTTVTITIASPGVVTWTGHSFENGDPIVLTTTGALPTGLTAGTTYYIVNKAANTFQLSATVGGAAINTSGTQSGTHTGIHAPYGRGDTSTTFNVPDLRGRVLIALDNLGGTAASRITSSSTNGANSTSLAGVGGAQTHTLIDAEVPSQQITIATIDISTVDAFTGMSYSANRLDTGSQTYTSEGGGGAHSNTQPWMAVSYIIKT
jgi:microcystin-dependent protein